MKRLSKYYPSAGDTVILEHNNTKSSSGTDYSKDNSNRSKDSRLSGLEEVLGSSALEEENTILQQEFEQKARIMDKNIDNLKEFMISKNVESEAREYIEYVLELVRNES